MTVTLIRSVEEQLRQLQERTDLSRTDLTNRAITLYEFFDAQMRDGHDLISRDQRTGKTELVRFDDAPAGQATSAGPAFARRGPAGPRWWPLRRLGRHRSPHPSTPRLAIASRLLLINTSATQKGTS
jgi:hypothetical protein